MTTPESRLPSRHVLRGPLLTILLLLFVEIAERTFLHFPNPDAVAVAAVVYAALAGGVAPGLVSAGVTLLYSLYFFSQPGQAFAYDHDDALRLFVLAIATPTLALMAGVLKSRLDREVLRAQDGELRTRAVMDGVADGIITIEEGGRIATFTSGAERILGVGAGRVLGRTTEVVPQLAQVLVQDASVGPIRSRLEVARSDGSRVPIELAVTTIAVEGRRVQVGILRDLSATETVARQAAALKEQAALLDLAHDTIMVRDMASTILFWNHGAEEMYAYSREQAVGRSSHELLRTVFPEPLERIEEELTREGRWEGELVHERSDGRRIVVASRWALQRSAAGEPLAVLEINNDITARKQAMDALERQASTLREQAALLDLAHDTIMVRDLKSTILFWNQGAREMYGFTPEEAIGRSSHELLRTIFPVPLPAIDAELLERGRWEGELLHATKEGRHIVAASRWALVKDGNGRPTAVLEINNDVTERRRAEQALARLGRQNKLILDSVGEGIYGVDLAGITTFVNPAAAKMLGFEAHELRDRPVHDLFHEEHEAGDERHVCPVLRTLADGNLQHVSGERHRRKEGSRFPVEYVCAPLMEGTNIVGAVVAFRDVTEREAMERVKNELISVVSHELRTPLTAIRGALGLLSGGALGSVPERGRRMLDVALQSSERLSRLVGDILDLERLEAGSLVMAKEPCDAEELVIQAVEQMRPLAAQEGIRLVAMPGRALFEADPDRVLQTLTNLLANAIKFSPPGSTVRAVAAAAGEQVRFSVSDEGRGIPLEKQAQIFERFVQVDASDDREKSGTGLGLAICRKIVEQHGGRIWVESAAGKGSTFSFEIPCGQVGEERTSAPAVPAPWQRGVPGRTVLVIDDDEVMREVALASLEQVGRFDVFTARSGEEGLRLAQSEEPDAILLDVMMPDMDGTAVVTQLRANPRTRGIPVVFLTAKSRAADGQRLASLEGVSGVIGKPFDPMKLPEEIAALLHWDAA